MEEPRLGIVIGTVTSCQRVEGTRRLFELRVNVGGGDVLVATSLPSFLPEGALLGTQVPVKTDVEPATIHGVRSTARLLALRTADGRPVMMAPATRVPDGTEVV